MTNKIEKDCELKDCSAQLMREIREYNKFCEVDNPHWHRKQLHSMKFFLNEIEDNIVWYRDQIEAIETALRADN